MTGKAVGFALLLIGGLIAVIAVIASGALAGADPRIDRAVTFLPVLGIAVPVLWILMLRRANAAGPGAVGVDWGRRPIGLAAVRNAKHANVTTGGGDLYDVSVDVFTADGRELAGVVRMGLHSVDARDLVPGTVIPVAYADGDPVALATVPDGRVRSGEAAAAARAVRARFGLDGPEDIRLHDAGVPARARLSRIRRTGEHRCHHERVVLGADILHDDGTVHPVEGALWLPGPVIGRLEPGVVMNVRVDPLDASVVSFRS